MEKEFVPYQESLEIKELGFDEPCFAFFQVEYAESKPIMIDDEHEYRTTGYRTCKNSEIPQHYTSAPTYSQAFRFFREKYKLHSSINLGVSDEQDRSGLEYDEYIFVIEGVNGRDYDNYNTPKFSKSPEEAELACLRKLIEIVKNK